MKISAEDEETLKNLESDADAAFWDDKYEELLKICRISLEIDHTREWAWERQAQAQNHLEQYPQAIESYLNLIQLDDQNANAYSSIADIYSGPLDQYEEALNYYMIAHEIEPLEPRHCLSSAQTSILAQKYGDAASFFEEALELVDDQNQRLEIMQSMAEVYSINEDHGNAIRICLELMRMGSTDPSIWNLTGDCYYALGDPGSSIAFYDQAIKRDPDNPKYHHNLFYAYIDLQDGENGILAINEVLRLDPENSAVLSELGRVHLDLKNLPEAKTSLEKSLEIDPDDGNTHYHLHHYFSETGNLTLSEMHLKLANQFGHDF